VSDHEGHFFGGDVLSGDDEVAFIFARGIVQDDYEIAVSWEDLLDVD
jgi:acyl-CoA hydrolase